MSLFKIRQLEWQNTTTNWAYLTLLPLLVFNIRIYSFSSGIKKLLNFLQGTQGFCNHLTAQMEWMQVTSLQGGKKKKKSIHKCLGEFASHPRKATELHLLLHDQDWFVTLQSLQLSLCARRCRHADVQLEGFNFSNCSLQLFTLTKLHKASIWSQLGIFTTLQI